MAAPGGATAAPSSAPAAPLPPGSRCPPAPLAAVAASSQPPHESTSAAAAAFSSGTAADFLGRSSCRLGCILAGSTSLGSNSYTPLGGLRTLVSGSKKRFQEGGFDLDLSYISCKDEQPRLIALGLPATGLVEPLYRNPLAEVRAFLDTYHPKRYVMVNLCSERDYADTEFPDSLGILRFRCDDHHAPPLHLILLFCQRVHSLLSAGSETVVAVHCKAGKGRTGVMICSYLIWRQGPGAIDAATAVRIFREARTSDGDAVTSPSQVRYVHLFEQLVGIPAAQRERMLLGPCVRVFAVSWPACSSSLSRHRSEGDVSSTLSAAPATLRARSGSDEADVMPAGRSGTAIAAAGAMLSALGGPATSWTLQLDLASIEVREQDDGATAHTRLLASSSPVQCAAGAPAICLRLPTGGVRLRGELQISLRSLGAVTADEKLLWLHLHTSFLSMWDGLNTSHRGAGSDALPAAASTCRRHQHPRTARFGKSEVDKAHVDARLGENWSLCLHYCYEGEADA